MVLRGGAACIAIGICRLVVKQAREEKQWDQQYLADELDIDIRTLKKIEAGKSDISFDTLSSLIHLLEISPKILVLC